ncbi:ROK family protein [Marinobacter sp.]|uniref:ROK family protein n=1 Tax=Marinobacter sp. TaxID=50741 RepID=UPI002B26EC61|nr:ROK family protein [Marinobacter sp.]
MHSNWLVGIDLGGTKTEVILIDRESNERFRKRVATPAGDYRATLETIHSLVLAAESQAGEHGLPVGVGIPGSISGITGTVKNCNSVWLNGQPMQKDLSALLQRPVILTNDANCLALSEATDGTGKNQNVVFAAILGTGCGAGISVNGRILTGPNGVAGEWGHNPLAWTPQTELNQRPCFCGRYGCNETFLSGTGLSHTHRLLHGQQLPAKTIAENALQGDKKADESMSRYLDHLARGIAAVINVLDPDVVVLGGGMSNAEQIYQELPERLPSYVFGGECDTPVVRAVHGDSSGVRGAAWLGGNEGSE